jgi:UDP-N-acetylglucosamine acyltransferase
MSGISELAVIDSGAQIGSNVSIGPFCKIGGSVVIGDGCELMNNVTIEGVTRIGSNNVFYQNVVIGVAPQDLKYRGAPTETIIGDSNVLRENCTVHRGTELGGGRTIIGNNNLLMVGVHIAHDCRVVDKTILGNQTLLAGHVDIEEGVVISALVGIHHFVTIGKYSYIAAMTPVRRDVPPFMKFAGDPNEIRGVNEEGLKRNGFSKEDIAAFKQAYRRLYRQSNNNIVTVLEEMLLESGLNENVKYLCEFLSRSCQSRFARFQESERLDNADDRVRRNPFETRTEA